MSVYPVPEHLVVRGAVLSDEVPTPLYRYALTRRWADGPAMTFVMLNPSTADATIDDHTIRKCVAFAAREGLNGIRVVNLYAYRATKPAVMFRHQSAGVDVVGPDADGWLTMAAMAAAGDDAPLVAAWGVNAQADRVEQVRHLIGGRLVSFGTTKDGHPRHPLMLAGDSALEPWPPPEPPQLDPVVELWRAGALVPHTLTMLLNAGGHYGPEVDAACGAEEPAVDMWEAGTLYPTLEQVYALAELVGVMPEYLFKAVSQDDHRLTGPAFLCGRDGTGCHVLTEDGVEHVLEYPADVVRATVGDA